MSRYEIENALNELIKLYQKMEIEYGINLTEEVMRVLRVKEDLPEVIWRAEVGINL